MLTTWTPLLDHSYTDTYSHKHITSVLTDHQHRRAQTSSTMSLTTTADLSANMRATTEAFLQTWTGNWVDATELNLALRAPHCLHTTLPSSLSRIEESNGKWAAKFKRVAPLITNGKVSRTCLLLRLQSSRAMKMSSRLCVCSVTQTIAIAGGIRLECLTSDKTFSVCCCRPFSSSSLL